MLTFTRFGMLAALLTYTMLVASILQTAQTSAVRGRAIAALAVSVLAIVYWMGWGAGADLAQTKALRVALPGIGAALAVLSFALLVSLVRALEVATRAADGDDLKTVAQRYI